MIFYVLWYNVIRWSSHTCKKSSFLLFYSFLLRFSKWHGKWQGKIDKVWHFPKIFIKMKNWTTFYEAQTASHLKEITQPPPNLPAPDKILLLLWNKNFLTELYWNIQTFAFKVLQECSSFFFLTPNRNMFSGKLLKSERLLPFCRSILFSMSSESHFVKWVKFFWAKLCCKMNDFFG